MKMRLICGLIFGKTTCPERHEKLDLAKIIKEIASVFPFHRKRDIASTTRCTTSSFERSLYFQALRRGWGRWWDKRAVWAWLESLVGREATNYYCGVRWFVGCMKPATLIGGMQGWRCTWRLSPCEALWDWWARTEKEGRVWKKIY